MPKARKPKKPDHLKPALAALDASDSAPMRDILAGNRFEAQKQGVIAVISSVAGDRGRQSNYVYGAAKGAVSIFLQGLRNRLHKSGVQVLTIKTGFVDTPMTARFKKGPLWSSRRGGCLQHQLSMAGLCMPRI